MIISYISIQNYIKEINTIWKCPLLPSLLKSCSRYLIFFIWQVSPVLKQLLVKEKKKLWLPHCLIKTTKIWIGKIKKKMSFNSYRFITRASRVYHIWRTNQIKQLTMPHAESTLYEMVFWNFLITIKMTITTCFDRQTKFYS